MTYASYSSFVFLPYLLEIQFKRLISARGQSLASSVTRYRYENGRRYHAFRKSPVQPCSMFGSVLIFTDEMIGDGTYYGPNDDTASAYETIVYVLSATSAAFRKTSNNRTF